jgi:hypothetical protein
MADNDRLGNAFDLSSMTAVSAAYQKKILEITQANAQASFDFAQSLMACRTPQDFIKLTQDYTRDQIERFQRQATELVELARSQSK